MVVIRPASFDDLPAINEIYNQAILTTVATFDTEEKSLVERAKWFEDHGPKNPILVAENQGNILGWAALNKYSNRKAYSETVEASLYVREEVRGKGIGKKLFQALVEEGKKVGVHSILSRITEGNEVSVRLHENLGFQSVGVIKEVGKKFGRLLDVRIMQKIYRD